MKGKYAKRTVAHLRKELADRDAELNQLRQELKVARREKAAADLRLKDGTTMRIADELKSDVVQEALFAAYTLGRASE